MSLIRSLVVFGALGLVVLSCFDPPTYSPVPEITLAGLRYTQNDTTLTISLDFKDGDGDLGLNADRKSDAEFPYNEKFYFRFPDGKLLNYKSKRTNPNYDTLPAYTKPFDCINWQIDKEKVGNVEVVKDTIYFQLNPNHYNIFVDFLVQDNNGTFNEFDFRKEVCATFDSRLPELFKEPYQAGPLEGRIDYRMKSLAFLITFSIKTLKLRVQIQDRALNKSNTIITPAFTLQSIK